MGYSRNDPDDWAKYATKTATKTTAQVFTARGMEDDFNPKNITLRESRDSIANPQSTPIIINGDITGSMGMLAEALIRRGIGVTFDEILRRKPVTDPHIMVMANGDVTSDRAPLQVTQFEADSVTLATQLERIYLEGNGGGNGWESYNLPWYFAAEKTAIDSIEKRGKKGYLFTIGDEEVPEDLTRAQIEKVFGHGMEQATITNRGLLAMVSRKFEVYHLVAEEGHHCRYSKDEVYKGWRELLGERVIPLTDHTKLSEVIVSLIEINEGRDRRAVIDSWDGTTSMVVKAATENLSLARTTSSNGLTTL